MTPTSDNHAAREPVSRGRGFRITSITVIGVGVLITSAVGLALFLGVGSAARNTVALWAEQADTLIEAMQGSLKAQLDPVAQQGEWIAARVESGELVLDGSNAMNAFFTGALSGLPQLAGIAVVDTSGLSRHWDRDTPAAVEEDWSNEPGVREWLDAGRQRDRSSWQSPLWTPTLDTTVLLHDTPLTNNGQYLGMLAQVVPVSSISVEFTRDYASRGLMPFVLYGDDKVLAHPLLRQERGELTAGVSVLPTLDELGDAVLSRIWLPSDTQAEINDSLDFAHANLVNHRNAEYMFLYRRFEQFGPLPWTVGVYFDTGEHGEREARRIVVALSGGLAVLLVAVIIASIVGLRVSHRIRDLAAAARRVETGDITSSNTLSASGIREIDEATQAFDAMVTGLRERDLIRETLGRFVPSQVAHHLLDGGGHLEPRASEATVLFCDIEGFAALTEAAGPHGTIDFLNAFFSEMVAILARHGGTVTQFQGDAILATFNVPSPDPEHAHNALSAALEMVDCASQRMFAGRRIGIRIGVNTGPIIAGAVGAKGRLSYTVHGDAVNLAARLESLNKHYATRILTTEFTAAVVSGIELREVEQVKIRGQSHAVRIYEVLKSRSA